MSLATDESYKNAKDEWVKNTTWHNIAYWRNKKDEPIDFLKKGNLISVPGKLNIRKYTDKQGQNRYITEVIAQNLEEVHA